MCEEEHGLVGESGDEDYIINEQPKQLEISNHKNREICLDMLFARNTDI